MNITAEMTASLSRELEEYYRLLIDTSQTLKAPKKAIRNLLGRSKLSHKLNTLGLSLILLPEPTEISDVTGLLILAFGKLFDKLDASIFVEDIFQQAHSVINELLSYREQIFS